MEEKTTWIKSSDKQPPWIDRILAIDDFGWVFVAEYKQIGSLGNSKFYTPSNWDINRPIIWWHELPELPWKEDGKWIGGDPWIDCSKNNPPQPWENSLQFILFDEEVGITECEYWGGYQTDVFSLKSHFNKPLFWQPFPRLPVDISGILQW